MRLSTSYLFGERPLLFVFAHAYSTADLNFLRFMANVLMPCGFRVRGAQTTADSYLHGHITADYFATSRGVKGSGLKLLRRQPR